MTTFENVEINVPLHNLQNQELKKHFFVVSFKGLEESDIFSEREERFTMLQYRECGGLDK